LLKTSRNREPQNSDSATCIVTASHGQALDADAQAFGPFHYSFKTSACSCVLKCLTDANI